MSAILTLLTILLSGPVHAGVRTAVVAVPPVGAPAETPTGGSWPLLVDYAARETAEKVRDAGGLELALPLEWSRSNDVLHTTADASWSDARVVASLEDRDVAQAFLVSARDEAGQWRVLVRRVQADGESFELGTIVPPAARTVEEIRRFEADVRALVERGAEPLVPVEITAVDARTGTPIEGVRIEVPGVRSGRGPRVALELPAGTHDVLVDDAGAVDRWVTTRARVEVGGSGAAVRVDVVPKALLTVDAPRNARVSVEGRDVPIGEEVYVAPNARLVVLVTKGGRRKAVAVTLAPGQSHTEKVRFPLFGE